MLPYALMIEGSMHVCLNIDPPLEQTGVEHTPPPEENPAVSNTP